MDQIVDSSVERVLRQSDSALMQKQMDDPANKIDMSALGASKDLTAPPPELMGDRVFNDELLDIALRYCLENQVEDFILLSGRPWAVMWSGQVRIMGQRPISTAQLNELANKITGDKTAAITLHSQAVPFDGAYVLRIGRGQTVRFRLSITGCLGADGYPGLHFVIRPAGKIPKPLEEMGLPDLVVKNCTPESGIVIVTGPTGSGKTTLLDAVVRRLATHPDGKHILTFYAPIENDLNVIPGITGIISQCQIGAPGRGSHLLTFADGVANALRRHPHAVVVGEARDSATIAGAVELSMTGHATYTTSHTSNVEMTIARMADHFGSDDRLRITNALIDNTRLIVHQRLVQTPSGFGRAPVRSFLVMPQELRTDLLKLQKIDHLPAALYEAQADPQIGLRLYDDALAQFEAGKIHENAMLAIASEFGP